MAVWEYYGENNFEEAVRHTQQSIVINLTDSSSGSPWFAIGSYNNLGIYYRDNLFYKEALNAFDSCIALSEKYQRDYEIMMDAKRRKRKNILSDRRLPAKRG